MFNNSFFLNYSLNCELVFFIQSLNLTLILKLHHHDAPDHDAGVLPEEGAVVL